VAPRLHTGASECIAIVSKWQQCSSSVRPRMPRYSCCARASQRPRACCLGTARTAPHASPSGSASPYVLLIQYPTRMNSWPLYPQVTITTVAPSRSSSGILDASGGPACGSSSGDTAMMQRDYETGMVLHRQIGGCQWKAEWRRATVVAKPRPAALGCMKRGGHCAGTRYRGS